MNMDEQISFILRFAQVDLSAPLRSSALRHLRGQMAAFFKQTVEDKPAPSKVLGFVATPQDAPLPNAFTPAQFLALQKDVLRIMKGGGGLVELHTTIQTIAPLHLNYGPIVTMIGGPVRDVFLLMTSLLLVRPEVASRLRQCPAPYGKRPGRKCDKMFLRIRKQQYCTKTCANRVSKQKGRGGA